jgi:hypothetical protein
MDNFNIRKFLTENKLTSVSMLAEDQDNTERIEGGISKPLLEKFLQCAKDIYQDHQDSGEMFYAEDVAQYLCGEIEKALAPMDIDASHLGENTEEEGVEGEIMPEVEVSTEVSDEVKEYVQEALKGTTAEEVAKIIERTCNKGAIEMQLEVISEIIAAYESKINSLEEDTSLAGIIDNRKMNEMKKIVKGLHKEYGNRQNTYERKYSEK